MTELDLVQGRILPDDTVPLGPFDRTLSVGGAHGLFESANLFVTRRAVCATSVVSPQGSSRAHGGCLTVRRPFGEDVIFGWQAVRSGARTGFCAEALAYHEVRPRGPLAFVSERSRLASVPAFLAADSARVARAVLLPPEIPQPALCQLRSRACRQRAGRCDGPTDCRSSRRSRTSGCSPRARGAGVSGARPEVACVEAMADVLGALALLRGSIASGSLLL